MGAKGSIDERVQKIEDYYNVFKIEINKEYFLAKTSKTGQKRRASAKFCSLDPKNAFNFEVNNQKQLEKTQRNSIMNTSIDKIKLEKQEKGGEFGEAGPNRNDLEKRKRSTFFLENTGKSGRDKQNSNKKSIYYEKNIYTNEVQNYKQFPTTKFKPKPRFSLEVNEYQAPKKNLASNDRKPKTKFFNPMRTNTALYNNRILEETHSKGTSPLQAKGERTPNSRVFRSPNLRSMSLRESKQTENLVASMRGYGSWVHSYNSHERNCSTTFRKVENPEKLNHLLQKQSEPPLQNWSMMPNRQFPKLHQSNNILPNSEDLRKQKIQAKASLESNVKQLRFQNYQTIVSLKSEMNLHSNKLNYKKKQRQVLKNFRHPQSPFVNGRPAFKSSSSIESGDSDDELKLDKAYCLLCGEDFG